MGLGQEARRGGREFVLNTLVGAGVLPRPLRWRLLRSLGLRVDRSTINSGVWFGGRDVAIGKDTFVNIGVVFDNSATITVGRDCSIGHQVLMCTSTHEPGTDGRAAGPVTAAPIVIEDGAWVGARATILPGVTVGAGCTIAAGAVVVEDCKPGGVYGGVPARLIR